MKLVVAVDRKFVVYDVIYIKCPVPSPKEDWRSPPKLPTLEHVALISASEAGAKMNQNEHISESNVKKI